jgi:hypothetical protein
MSALIGALRASLSLETAQFEAGAKRAQRVNNGLHSSFKRTFGGIAGIAKAGLAGVISGLSVGLLIRGAKAGLDYAASLGEVSQQLGVTTRDLQVFRYAAGQVGVSQEQLEKGLQKLTITMGQLAAGAKAPRAALEGVRKGLADQIMTAKDGGDAFRILADALEPVTSRAQRAAVEIAVMGRSGAQLDNLLSGGSKALNQLALAAEELGIVLSAEQIAKADETADKLEAVKTVLSAQIAGVVADNAQAIIGLADSLAYLVSQAAQAAQKMAAFYRAVAIDRARQVAAHPGLNKVLFGTKGSAAILRAGAAAIRANAADKAPPKAAVPTPAGGTDIGKFLASGGGSKNGRSGSDDAERKRQEALRNAFQFDQELLRAQQDVLRAQQSLATDYSERAALAIQMLNLEQQGFEREMQYAVASGELSKAQAAQLQAEFAKKDALERQAVLAEEEAQRKEDYNRLDQLDFDLQRDILESQEQLADTAKEQRDIRLRLLELDYRAEKARLDAVLADEQASYAAKEEARRRLANLNKTFGNDREATIRATAGPFEQAQMQFGDLSEEMENLRVNGIMAAGDALATLATEGFGSFKEQAISAIQAVIAEFIRLQMIKMLFNVIGGGAGTGGIGVPFNTGLSGAGLSDVPLGVMSTGSLVPGFASGGGFNVMGRKGVDKNLLQLNGLPIARVSHGERVSISNDNQRMGGAGHTFNFAFSGPVTRETQLQVSAAARRGIAQANRKGAP